MPNRISIYRSIVYRFSYFFPSSSSSPAMTMALPVCVWRVSVSLALDSHGLHEQRAAWYIRPNPSAVRTVRMLYMVKENANYTHLMYANACTAQEHTHTHTPFLYIYLWSRRIFFSFDTCSLLVHPLFVFPNTRTFDIFSFSHSLSLSWVGGRSFIRPFGASSTHTPTGTCFYVLNGLLYYPH